MADCMHKLVIRNKKTNEFYEVPCRVCIPCRKRRAAALKRFCEVQQQEFYKRGQSCSFNCLTYTDRSLPRNSDGLPTICKKDFQNFMKRFRKNLSKSSFNMPFKFLACGEYGDQDGRPHYHFILFGISDAVADSLIRKSWQTKKSPKLPLGKCDVKPLLAGGISYVCDYIITSLNGELARQKYDEHGIERPFTCHSQGFGIEWLFANEENLLANNFVDTSFSSKPFLIPKYYRDYYNMDLSHSFNCAPIVELVHKKASKFQLSDSDYSAMQQRISVKNARLQTVGSALPVEQDSPDVPFHHPKGITESLALQASDIDTIPF